MHSQLGEHGSAMSAEPAAQEDSSASAHSAAAGPVHGQSKHAQYGEHWGEGAARCFSLESDILDEDHAVRLMPVPDNFLCPISAAIMVDPVATVDGCVYERQYIERWFRERRQQGQRITSPITGLELPSATLMPLVALQRAIEVYLAHRPELKREHMAGRSFEEAAQILQTDLFEKQQVHATAQDKLKRLKQANKALERALQEAESRIHALESERLPAATIAPRVERVEMVERVERVDRVEGECLHPQAAALRSSTSSSCSTCGKTLGAAGDGQAAAVLGCMVGGRLVASVVLLLLVLVLVSLKLRPVAPNVGCGGHGSGQLPVSLVAPVVPSAAVIHLDSEDPHAGGSSGSSSGAAGAGSSAGAGAPTGAAAGGAAESSKGSSVSARSDNPAFAGQLEHLRTGSLEEKQKAAFLLRMFASEHAENQAAIARAGAIAPLIDLLQEGTPSLREEAARALWNLARNRQEINVNNQREIGHAGAIAPLVKLLEDDVPRVRTVAAAVLNDLATDNIENQVAVAKAGAIAPLVGLLQNNQAPALVMAASLLKSLAASSGDGDVQVAMALAGAVQPLTALLRADNLFAQEQAASTLGVLAAYSPEIQGAIAQAGAIDPLVERLKGDMMQGTAALALRNLAAGSLENQQAIVEAGAIMPLVQLLEDGMPGVREEAACALWNLAMNNSENQVEIVRAGAAIPLVALLKGDAQEQATLTLLTLDASK